MLHADDDGPSQHDARRAAAHHRTQQRLAPSQGQSEEAETWARGGHGVSLHSRVMFDMLRPRSESALEPMWRAASVQAKRLTLKICFLFNFSIVFEIFYRAPLQSSLKIDTVITLARFKSLIMS